ASTVQQRLNEVAAVGQEIAETGVAYLDGKFTPLGDAKVSIATHALQYGTGVFEGIRAYWNPAQEQLYVFRLREHFERMARSVRIMRIALPGDAALITPPVTDDILEGITRDSILEIAAELGILVQERQIDRTELYVADEVFFCGTGAQVAPCVKIDGRQVGDGQIGPIAKKIGEVYFAIAHGDDKRHSEWRTAVYP